MKSAFTKETWKEPVVYYIAAPVIIALWPLLIGFYYIPNIDQSWEKEKDNYTQAQEQMRKILALDQGRLAYRNQKKGSDFDYAVAIYNVNKKLGIREQNCDISSKPLKVTQGRKTKSCQVVINEIDIVRLARFLSDLQITWASLQAEKITLTKQKELPDSWKTDITFNYFY